MAYSTGTAINVSDLLSAVFTFAQANGFAVGPTWTTNQNVTRAATTSATVWTVKALTKNGIYYFFQYTDDQLYMNTATGSNGTGAIQKQPGAFDSGDNEISPNACVFPITGPYAGYHLFADANLVNVVIELVPGVFRHFAIGEITGIGTLENMPTVMGSNSPINDASNNDSHSDPPHALPWLSSYDLGWTSATTVRGVSHVRSRLTNGPAIFPSVSGSATKKRVYTLPYSAENTGRFMDHVVSGGPNPSNGRAPLVPIIFFEPSTYPNGGPFTLLGYPSNVRLINIRNLDPKSTVNTDWMVFPLSQKNGGGMAYLNSENLGLAYKK